MSVEEMLERAIDILRRGGGGAGALGSVPGDVVPLDAGS
jgi:hypothetical protein